MNIREVPLEQLAQLVAESFSYSEVLRKLGYTTRGKSHYIIKEVITDAGLPVDHFKNIAAFSQKLTDEEYFVDGVRRTGHGLKKRLIDNGHLEEKCGECGIGPEWNGKPLSLQVDHIDGDSEGNRLINLRLLCPNCHTQTETYAGRRFKIRRQCGCGAEIFRHNKSGLCVNCCRKRSNRKFKTTKKELRRLLSEYSANAIGKMLGVSGHTIKKYGKRWNLIT